jgi:hypothetical protein
MATAVDIAALSSVGIGGLLPIVVGLVTKVATHPALKGSALLSLAGGTGLISQWIASLNSGAQYHWPSAAAGGAGAFVAGVSAHSAIWKHTKLSNSGTPIGQSPSVSFDDALISPLGLVDDFDTSDLAGDLTSAGAALPSTNTPNGSGAGHLVPAQHRFEP